MSPQEIIFTIFKYILGFLGGWWWLVAPCVLFALLYTLWENYVKIKYLTSLEWVLLEVRIPKIILKTPKSMENIFTSMHAIATYVGWYDKTFHGKVQNWASFEVVGTNGSIHFFIRTLKAYRNFTEAQVYAQYPDAEVNEVRDYVSSIPRSIPDGDYDLWGAEMKLTKADAYPIRTYIHFEEMVEERRTDPMSSLTEFFAKMRNGEEIWLHFIIKPAGDQWKKDGDELVKQLTGKDGGKKKSSLDPLKLIGDIFGEMLSVLSAPPADPNKKGSPQKAAQERKETSQIAHMTPRQRDIVKAIEENISKIGFDTTIRFAYVARKDMFERQNIAGVVGFFKQFNTMDMNGFAININTMTSANYLLRKSREFMKKRVMFRKLMYRSPSSGFVLNTEELATVCHFPAASVVSPMLPKIEARRGEPPATLPVV